MKFQVCSLFVVALVTACGSSKSAQITVTNQRTAELTVRVHMAPKEGQKIVYFKVPAGQPASKEWDYAAESDRPGFPGKAERYEQSVIFTEGTSTTIARCMGKGAALLNYTCSASGCAPDNGDTTLCATP